MPKKLRIKVFVYELIKTIWQKSGVDRAVFFVLLGRGVSFLTQPITIYLVVRFFTMREQGFYYTFANILYMSTLLELGLGVVITQFASHEFAHLHWNEGVLAGKKEHLDRLLTVLYKSLKWYFFLSLLYILILIPVGLLFFGSSPESSQVSFKIPWCLLVLFSAINVLIFPVLTVLEGCGKVADLQKMRLWQAISGAICVWLVIVGGGSLLAASVLAFANFVVSVCWILRGFRGLVRQAMQMAKSFPTAKLSWLQEIFPMQWRIALSWTCGFLISQLFNPFLFRYQGATVAGQMGMSISISNIALSVSIAWISTRTPTYGSLIQKHCYRELDDIALKSTLQALFFSVLMTCAVLASVYLIKLNFPQYGDRVLSISAIGALLFSNIMVLLITSMAGYLRAHKVEPLLIVSVITGVSTALSAWVCAKYFSAEVMAYSIACINLLMGLPLTGYVFIRKRREWHSIPATPVLTNPNVVK